MVRLIVDSDPPKPSTRVTESTAASYSMDGHGFSDADKLCRLLRGELDWIVMKAIEKDRVARYETASAFADDIERHLNEQPVLAGPPNAIYKARKFVRRNKVLVIASSAVALALIVGLAAAVAGYLSPAIDLIVSKFGENTVWNGHLSLVKSHSPSSDRSDIEASVATAEHTLKTIGRLHDDMVRVALAKGLDRLGKKSEAAEVLKTGLEDRSFEYSYPWLIMEQRLIQLLKELKRPAEVEEVLRDIIQYRVKRLTPNHLSTLLTKIDLAEWLCDQGKMIHPEEHILVCRQLLDHENAQNKHKVRAIHLTNRIKELTQAPVNGRF